MSRGRFQNWLLETIAKEPEKNPAWDTAACTGAILTGMEIAKEIKEGRISISEYDSLRLNPNSYNLSIGDKVIMYDNISMIDLHDPNTFADTMEFDIPSDGFVLRPGNLYLVSTKETIRTEKYVPFITGRSSIGRLGISVHHEAGLGDIGFSGQMTHQIQVVYPTKIYAGDVISQVYFLTPCGATDIMYYGKYQNSKGPQKSQFEGSKR